MINKQICMYGLQQGQNNSLIKGKRPSSISLPSLQDSDILNLIRKKVKTETNESEVKTPDNQGLTNSDIKIQEQSTTQQTVGFQTCSLSGSDKKDLMNNLLFTSILNPNTPNSKTENSNSNSILIPYIQNSNQVQQSNAGNSNSNLLPNSNISQLALAQFISQNMKIKPLTVTNNGSSNNGPNVLQNNTESNSSFNISKAKNIEQPLSSQNYETLMREFQNRILGLLITQNKMLVDLKEKNEILQDTLACLINEINALKSTVKSHPPNEKVTPAPSNPLYFHQIIGNSTDTVTTENLLTYLYGPNPDFQYHLILKSELPLPLYRERNFKFTVLLVDKNGTPVENTNRIALTIGIYSSENPPKYIDANTSGNKILKGFIEKDLVSGSATFEKIQIKEVTSHFRNGWVFFVVYPKLVSVGSNTIMLNGHNIVNSSKIKPLILEKVVVKAKKSKERDNLNESSEVYNDDDVKMDDIDRVNIIGSKEEIVYPN